MNANRMRRQGERLLEQAYEPNERMAGVEPRDGLAPTAPGHDAKDSGDAVLGSVGGRRVEKDAAGGLPDGLRFRIGDVFPPQADH